MGYLDKPHLLDWLEQLEGECVAVLSGSVDTKSNRCEQTRLDTLREVRQRVQKLTF